MDMTAELRLVSERLKPLPSGVESLRAAILEASHFLLENPELGSHEHKAHDWFVTNLESRGFTVTPRYLGMDTAFLATSGSGRPNIGLFAEYDALPNGHACGHNVASAFAYGLALVLAASAEFHGAVYLFGTPDEEGVGQYASSKGLVAPHLKELGVDAAFFAHPKDEWEIGAATLSKARTSFVFSGREGPNSRPEEAINALDAAVQFYNGIKILKSTIPLRKYAVVTALIKDGGVTPKWAIPGRAETWIEIKTDDDALSNELRDRVRELAKGTASSLGVTVHESDVAPFVARLKRDALENAYYHAARAYLPEVNDPDTVWSKPVGGMSADIGNISQEVPTAYLAIKIGRKGMMVHTDEFGEMANSRETEEAILTSIAIGYEAVLEYAASLP
jgi:amidohydrolase